MPVEVVVHCEEPPPHVVVATLPAAFTVRQFDAEVPNAVMAKFVVVALPATERFPKKLTAWPNLPIVMPVAVDVPMEMVLELSITTAPSPEMLVPLKVSAASAGPAERARTPTVMPMMRSQALRLSSCDFIL